MAIEKIVAEDQRAWLTGDKLLSDNQRLGYPFGTRLSRIFDLQTQAAPITKERAIEVEMCRSRNDQDLSNIGQHEHREWVVDHRLIEDRQNLFRERDCQGVEPRAKTTR